MSAVVNYSAPNKLPDIKGILEDCSAAPSGGLQCNVGGDTETVKTDGDKAQDRLAGNPIIVVPGTTITVTEAVELVPLEVLEGPLGWVIAGATLTTVATVACVETHCLQPIINYFKNNNPPPPDNTKEDTPKTKPDKFRPVKGRPGKVNVDTGEVWVRDPSAHGGEHYEVYDNVRDYENGVRGRQVWADGTPGKTY